MQTFLLFLDQRYETVLIYALNKSTPPPSISKFGQQLHPVQNV